ncbi:uncharacterized protein LOC129757819 isoform X2 [Uranotaenia lowii]|nr:uncharacterized protein LOC129757819 isoform X2 [Uranotaenia lowii]
MNPEVKAMYDPKPIRPLEKAFRIMNFQQKHKLNLIRQIDATVEKYKQLKVNDMALRKKIYKVQEKHNELRTQRRALQEAQRDSSSPTDSSPSPKNDNNDASQASASSSRQQRYRQDEKSYFDRHQPSSSKGHHHKHRSFFRDKQSSSSEDQNIYPKDSFLNIKYAQSSSTNSDRSVELGFTPSSSGKASR